MSQKMFRKSAIALAIAGAMASGGAYAATVTVNNGLVAPTLNGKVFGGNLGTAFRLKLTNDGTAMSGVGTVHIVYYNGSTQLNTRTATLPAASAGATTDVEFTMATDAQAGGAYDGFKIVLETNSSDDWDGNNNTYLAIKLDSSGALVADPDESSDVASTLTAALALADTIGVDKTYDGIKPILAQVDDAAAPTQIYVTFNADPKLTTTLAAPVPGDNALQLLNIKKDSSIVSQAQVQSNASIPKNILEIRETNGSSNAFSPAAVNKIESPTSNSTNNLSDGTTGNVVLSTTLTPVVLSEPAYATTGKVAVGVAATSVAKDTGVINGSVAITVRLDTPIADATTQDKNDVVVKAGTTPLDNTTTPAVSYQGVVSTADGKATLWKLTLAAITSGNAQYRFNPTTGVLQYTADSTANTVTWEDVTVQLKRDATAPITNQLASSKKIANNLAAVKVYAGSAPAVDLNTHGNFSGQLDGLVADFNFPVTLSGTTGGNITVNGHTGDGTTIANGKITISGASLVTATNTAGISDNAVQVLFDPATTYDWNKDGTADSADDTVFASFTTSTTGKYDYELKKANSTVTYASVFDKDTGTNKKATVSKLPVSIDGAAPVPVPNPSTIDANNPATVKFSQNADGTTGNLSIKFSENLTTTAPTDAQNVLIDGAPTTLLNVNAGLNAPTVNVSGAVLTVSGVDVNAVTAGTSKVSIASSPVPTAQDSAGNKIASTSAGVAIVDGGATNAAPAMLKAFTVLNQQGEVSNLVVVYDREVALASGATAEGIFKVRLTATSGGDVDVTIPMDKVIIDTANKKKVTLTLPINVNKGKFTDAIIEYDPNGANKLVSTDAQPVDVVDTGTAFAATNDGDTQTVNLSKNSTNLYVMEIKGSITDGGQAVPEGTLVRIDLISDTSLSIASATAVVPCATCGKPTIALNASGILGDIIDARAKGVKTLNAYINTKKSGNREWADAVLSMTDDSTDHSSPVTVDVNSGKITGATTGQIHFTQGANFSVVDTTRVVMDGSNNNIRVSIGSNTPVTKGFVMISAQKPGEDYVLLNTTVPQLAGFIPFKQELQTNGTVAVNANLDFNNIEMVKVPTGGTWKTLGLTGDLNYVSGQKKEIDPRYLFLSVAGDDGAPISFWNNNTNADMAFTLLDNKTVMAYEVGGKSNGKFNDLNGTWGLAVNDATVKTVGGGTPAGTANKLYLPVTGSPAKRDLGKGWQLFSATAPMSSAAFGTTFTAVICAGNGNQSKSWFAGETNNSLMSMDKGDACFGYTDAPKPNFQ